MDKKKIRPCQDIHTGLSTETIKQSILDNLHFSQAGVPELATLNDWYMAVAYAIRERMLDNGTKTISFSCPDST